MSPVSLKGLSGTTFLYEVRSTILSLPVLITMVLIILLSFALIASFTQSTAPNPTDEYYGYSYYEPGQVHVSLFTSDNYGTPVAGVTVTAALFEPGPGGTTLGPFANASGESGANGRIDLVFHIGNNQSGGYQVLGNLSDPHNPNLGGSGIDYAPLNFFVNTGSTGEVQALNGGGGGSFGIAHAVLSGTEANAPNTLQVFYLGPNGTIPRGYEVRYYLTFSNNQPAKPENQTVLLGNLTSAAQDFPLTIRGYSSSKVPAMVLEVFTPTGALAVATSLGSMAQEFYPPAVQVDAATFVFSFIGTVLALFIPFMAILAAYSAYGKDRTSGTIEAVLCQPISREGLVLSRYLAVTASLAISIGVTAGIIDLLTHVYSGAYLPLNDVLGFYAALVLVAGSFVALLFLLSHLLRTTGAVIGAGVGLVMLFTLFWVTVVTDGIAMLTGATSATAFETIVVRTEYLSPAGVIPLTQALLTNSIYAGSTFSPAAYGVTPLNVGLVGVAWILVPVALLLLLVKTRD